MTHDDKRAIALWRPSASSGPLTMRSPRERRPPPGYCAEAAARDPPTPGWTARPSLGPHDRSRRTTPTAGGGFRGAPSPAEPRRTGAGAARSPPHIAEHILRAERERPRRSIRRIIRMLERAAQGEAAIRRAQAKHEASTACSKRRAISEPSPRAG